MAKNMLTIDKINNINSDKVWFFRFKKFDDNTFLITNDVWKYHFLSEEEFEQLISWKESEIESYDELMKKGFIKNPKYIDKMSWSFLNKNHFVWLGPTLHMMVITLRCNHKCKYCHAAVAPMTAKEFDMNKETAKKVIDTIFYTNSPWLTIEFQWWEPLVNYEVLQYSVNYARERAFHLWKDLTMSMVSNLTLMTEDKLNWLLDNWVDICTSLDGDSITHNNNRVYTDWNSFEKVTYWIKRLDQEKQKRNMWRVGALLTVTKETLPKNRKIIDTYLSLWLDWIFLRWLNPYWFASASLDELAYEDEKWIEFYKDSLDYIIEINKSWTYFKEVITSVYLSKIMNPIDPAFLDIRSPSGLWIWWVAYNFDWKIYASDEARMLWRMWKDDFFMTEATEDWKQNYINMINSDVAKTSVLASTLDWLPWYNDHVYKPYLWVDIIHNLTTKWNLYVPLVCDKKMKLQISILDYIFEKLNDEESKKILLSWIN